jgi:hypothetical protein
MAKKATRRPAKAALRKRTKKAAPASSSRFDRGTAGKEPAAPAPKRRPAAGEQRFATLEGRVDVLEARMTALQAGPTGNGAKPPAVPVP